MSNRLDNTAVINAWLRGQRGSSHTGNLSTDGQKLFSYALVIGDTLGERKLHWTTLQALDSSVQ